MKANTSNIHFGKNLRRIRKQRGYTMARLANISGISERMISHYETQVKRPALDKIEMLADALDITINELMGAAEPLKKRKDDLPFKLMKKIRVIEELPTRDQNAIFQHINTVVQRHRLKEEIKHKK